MFDMFNRPRKSYKSATSLRSDDIGSYQVTLKIGTNNVVIGYILNEKFLKLYSHLPE